MNILGDIKTVGSDLWKGANYFNTPSGNYQLGNTVNRFANMFGANQQVGPLFGAMPTAKAARPVTSSVNPVSAPANLPIPVIKSAPQTTQSTAPGATVIQRPQPSPTSLPALTQRFIGNIMQGRTPSTTINVPADLKSAVANASKQTGIPANMLYALAQNETGMRNIPQEGGGQGMGYFQIDLGQHPNVSKQQALDPTYAALYAANLLKSYIQQMGNVTNGIQAYNGGPNGINTPQTLAYAQKYFNNLGNLIYK